MTREGGHKRTVVINNESNYVPLGVKVCNPCKIKASSPVKKKDARCKKHAGHLVSDKPAQAERIARMKKRLAAHLKNVQAASYEY